MRLENKQQEQVKVTISKYPFVKGKKGQSKSLTLYECSVDEVHEFFIEAIESSSEEEDEE